MNNRKSPLTVYLFGNEIEQLEKVLRETGTIESAMRVLKEATEGTMSCSPAPSEKEKKVLADAVEKIRATGTIADAMSLVTGSIPPEEAEAAKRKRRAALRKLDFC